VEARRAPFHVAPQPFQVVGRAGSRPRVGGSHDLSPSFASRQRRAVHHAFTLGGATAHIAAFATAAAAAAAVAGLLRGEAKKLSRQARRDRGRRCARTSRGGAASLRDRQSRSSAGGLAERDSASLRGRAESKLSNTGGRRVGSAHAPLLRRHKLVVAAAQQQLGACVLQLRRHGGAALQKSRSVVSSSLERVARDAPL
jgi:hypothetical protein